MQIEPSKSPISISAIREEAAPSPRPSVSTKSGISELSRRVDFSCITPRQLKEFLDDMIFSNQIDPEDVVALGNSLPSGAFFEQPDTPLDLRSTIEGMIEFDRLNGFEPLAAFYAGLLERMKLMEDRSVHISVRA